MNTAFIYQWVKLYDEDEWVIIRYEVDDPPGACITVCGFCDNWQGYTLEDVRQQGPVIIPPGG